MQVITPYTITDANLLSSNVAENDFPAFNIETTYGVGDTLIYIAPNIHWVVRSLVAGNVGNIPTGLSTDTKWVKVSETNRWKMFDLKSTSQTVNTGSISVTLGISGLTNAIYIGNVQGNNITVTGFDQYGTQIYSYSSSLIQTSGIGDAFNYFFSPIVFKKEIVLDDLPPYSLTSYTISITSQSIAKCGTLIAGYLQDAGATRYGMSIGIQDYSIKQANEFGDFVITQRAYSKRMSLDAVVSKLKTDAFIDFLNTYRATPLVWVGSEQYEGSFIYGFYKDYSVVVSYATETLFNLEIEGLS